mgnify:CR=1 FL=1
MKKFLIAISLMVLTSTAIAGHRGYHSHRHHGGHVAAGVITGMIIGNMIAQPRYQYVPAPTYYQPYTPVYEPLPMYRSVDVYIPECDCYRTVRVRVQ